MMIFLKQIAAAAARSAVMEAENHLKNRALGAETKRKYRVDVKKWQKIVGACVILLLCTTAMAQTYVSNIRILHQDGDYLFIMYDLTSTADIEVHVSIDGGEIFRGPLRHVEGAVGKSVQPERDKIIAWNVFAEYGSVDYENVVIKIIANANAITDLPADGMFLARKGKVYQLDQKFLNDRKLLGKKVFETRKPLTTSEVRQIMANSNALLGYDKGIKQNRNSNIWMVAGSAIAATGGIIMLTQPFKKHTTIIANNMEEQGKDYYYLFRRNTFIRRNTLNYPYIWGNNRTYDFYSYDKHYNIEIGGIVLVAGSAAIVTGVILKFSSRRCVQRSVNLYNNRGNALSRFEYDFNFTGNSAHLAIRF